MLVKEYLLLLYITYKQMYDYLNNKNDKNYEHQKEMLLQNYNEKTELNNKYFYLFIIYLIDYYKINGNQKMKNQK